MASIEDLRAEVGKLTAELEGPQRAKKAEEELRRKYRSVFTSPDGGEVLRAMLHDLYFMQIPTTENQVVLQAYAALLLRRIGIIERDGAPQGAIDALLAHARV